MPNINYLSGTCPRVEVNANGRQVGSASGFFYAADNENIFFVTNWHVVTGRSPTNPTVSSTGAVPVSLTLKTAMKKANGALIRGAVCEIQVELNDDEGTNPRWFEHPQFRHEVDVVVLKINRRSFGNETVVHLMKAYEAFKPELEPEVMQDVYVIGYPWGLGVGDVPLPIYKRGSVASDPVVGYNSSPRFLIDCRTAESMSGSPVIASHSGIWSPNGSKEIRRNTIMGTVRNLVGVYSGRLLPKQFEADKNPEISDIGVVWPIHLVDEIISGNTRGATLSQLCASARPDPK